MRQFLGYDMLDRIKRENLVELTDFFDILETVGDLLVMRVVLRKAHTEISVNGCLFLCSALKRIRACEEEATAVKLLAGALIERIEESLDCATLVSWIESNTDYTIYYDDDMRRAYRLFWIWWMDRQLDLLEDQYRATQVRPYGE